MKKAKTPDAVIAEPNEPNYFLQDQNATLEALAEGKIEDVRISSMDVIDKLVLQALRQGSLQKVLRSFPDPRKNIEVPIDALLLPQIIQRLNDEHSLLLAPYMLNSAELIEQLGYNARVLKEGFNQRNVHPRKAPFHGDTLKQFLLSTKTDSIVRWFNQEFLQYLRGEAPGRTKQYILDGTKIEVPEHLAKKYQNSGVVKNSDEDVFFGYKAVWLQEIIDNKGVIVALKIVPIERHDIDVGKELVAEFPFEPGSCLIMDRGFINGEWITQLKEIRGVDVIIPLRKNMDVTVSAVAIADSRGLWMPHPTREGQQIAEIGAKPGDLFWDQCPVLSFGVLVRWTKKDGTPTEVLFVTTQAESSGKKILATYDQRTEIEESHRQLKVFQELEKLPSKKFVQVVFRIVMGVVGYNLLNLFLNSEGCQTLKQFSLKTLRQKKPLEENPRVIIYGQHTFAILRLYQLLPLLMRLKGRVKAQLIALFESLDPKSAPF